MRDSSKWLFMNISLTPEKETRRFNRFGNLIETNLFFTIVGWCVMRHQILSKKNSLQPIEYRK